MITAAAKRFRESWLVKALCWFAVFSEGYDIGVLGAVLPGLMKDPKWHLSPLLAGALASAALIGMCIGGLGIGMLSDRAGRRACFLWCLALFSLSMAGAAFAPSPLAFAGFRLLSGIGIGGIIPVAAALTTEFAAPRRRNRDFALMYSGYSIGIFASAIVSFFWLQPFGWRAVLAVGVLPLLLVPIAWALLPESVAYLARRGRMEEAEQTARDFKIAIPGSTASTSESGAVGRLFAPALARATMGFALTYITSMILVFGLNTWLPQIMRSAGYALGPSILFLAVFALSSAIGGVILGAVSDRVGRRATTAGAFLMGAAAIVLLSWPMGLAATYVLVALAGIGTVSAAVLLTSYASAFYPPEMRATAVGFFGSISRSGAITGPMLGGVVAAQHLPFAWNFLVFAFVGLLAAGCIFIVPIRGGDGRRSIDALPA